MDSMQLASPLPGNAELPRLYRAVRETTRRLCAPLSDADATVQSMPDASPAKWHLAHTTWFFETFVLEPNLPGYRVFDARFNFLFNSYYDSLGARQPRPARGLLTRPTLATIHAYRDHVDANVEVLLDREKPASVPDLVELGRQHEQQHQELILTDLLHLFAQNPLKPAYADRGPASAESQVSDTVGYKKFDGGIVEIGHGREGFAFDCERPRHRQWIEPFKLADRLVTNGEWIEFIGDGGYRNPLLWLSDGWANVRARDWSAPLYWEQRDGCFATMTLNGPEPVNPAAPVVHVSYFEADAFAKWSGRRLPTEAEWEHAAEGAPVNGNFADSGLFHPLPAASADGGLRQMFGDVWEWTRSAFSPYPRFQPLHGAAGEYNGKFMSGQYVLRGGSGATPSGHVRPSYRNFFPPEARWQFSGLRLAEDG
jgi:ergothioneine biosynthesis protein EgtB